MQGGGYTCVSRTNWDSSCQLVQAPSYSQPPPPSRSREMDYSHMEQEALLQGSFFFFKYDVLFCSGLDLNSWAFLRSEIFIRCRCVCARFHCFLFR